MGRQIIREGKWRRKTDEEFRAEMQELHPNIVPLEAFTESHVPVLCLCKTCGYQWRARPGNLTFRGNPTGCPRCSGVMRKTTEDFRQEMAIKHPDIEIVGTYVDSHTPIKCLCLKHQASYFAIPTNLCRRKPNGCPVCHAETGESRLASELKEFCKRNFAGTVTEYRILKSPITGRWLPYDIFIPNNEDTGVDVYCEVMGSQHYQRSPSWQTEQAFKTCVARDVFKEAYAKAHGRYVEINTQEIYSAEDALPLLRGENLGWIAQVAYELNPDGQLDGATEYITSAYADALEM